MSSEYDTRPISLSIPVGMILELPLKDLVGTVIQVEALLHERQYGSDAPLGLRLDRLLRTGVETGQKVLAVLRHITADRQVLGDERAHFVSRQMLHCNAGTYRHNEPPISAPYTFIRCIGSSHLRIKHAKAAILHDPLHEGVRYYLKLTVWG